MWDSVEIEMNRLKRVLETLEKDLLRYPPRPTCHQRTQEAQRLLELLFDKLEGKSDK
jgi:hypothetical protein